MVDQLLGGLFGAKDDDDEPTRQRRARDYVDRYERGAYDQIGDDEALHNYRTATSNSRQTSIIRLLRTPSGK